MRSARVRRCGTTAAAAALVASAAAVSLPPATAVAEDDCTKPRVADVMISQGLPSYALLARGKTTLVKLYLHAPSCLPSDLTIAVTGGSVLTNTVGTLPVQALLPLPQLGGSSTAPVADASSDLSFYLPGSAVRPAGDALLVGVEVQYVVRKGDQRIDDGTMTVTSPPGAPTTTPLSAPVAPEAPTAGLLLVPMGDTARVDVEQYPAAARTATQNGMTALTRVMPVADVGGIDWRISAGMLNLGTHPVKADVPSVTTTFMPDGSYCGTASHLTYISAQLEAMRVAWNSRSENPRAQVALGQVWQGISRGLSTHTGPADACAEGYAQLPGVAGWSRTIASTLEGKPMTGSLAAHELTHTVGGVALDPERDPNRTRHSKATQADATAPDRAHDLFDRRWISEDRTVTRYQALGWHDSSTLFEKPDWDYVHCALLSGPAGGVGTSPCARGAQMTYAGATPEDGTIVITGSSDGTLAGTEAYSYESDDRRIDLADGDSAYALVQLSGSGVVRTDGVPFHDTYDDEAKAPGGVGTFGLAVPADPRTTRIELRRKGLTTPLYAQDRDAAPRVVSAAVGGTSVSVSVADEDPAGLRLDLFLQCPDGTSPLLTAVRPQVVEGLALFVTPYDASLGCAGGSIGYRVTDGLETAVGGQPGVQQGTRAALATIYAPTAPGVTTSAKSIPLAGAARTAAGVEVDDLVWTLSGPSEGVQAVAGRSAAFVPPKEGFTTGLHTVTLNARIAGASVATATRVIDIRPDADRDGIEDDKDLTCSGASAARDASNAVSDPDGDGLVSVQDTAPCTSVATVTTRFDPVSLFKSSSGTPVTVYLTGSKTDLTRLRASDVFVTQVAGHSTTTLLGSATALPAVSFKADSPTSAVVKLDRQQLQQALRSRDGLLGHVPLFVGTLDGSVRGADPVAPFVFP